MLIYEKRLKKKMKIVLSKEVVEALACDSTVSPSVLDQSHLFYVFPNLRAELKANPELIEAIKTEEGEVKEYFTLVDFDAAQKFVPNSIYRMIHDDNLKFLAEKQVFSDSFYKCTYELLHQCLRENQQDGILKMIYQTPDKVVWDLLINSS